MARIRDRPLDKLGAAVVRFGDDGFHESTPSEALLPSPPRGGGEGRVRWGCLQFSIDRIEYDHEIPHHIIIPKSDHAIAVRREFDGALLIRDGFIRMLAPVEFDDEFLFRALEIGNAVADRMLAAEFV